MTTLLPYQREGVDAIHSHNGRCLLGDSMGLGKTIQAWAYAKESKDTRPVIVICPAGLKKHWQREGVFHFRIRSVILYGAKKPSRSKAIQLVEWKYRFFIINYDIIPAWFHFLQSLKPKLIILDEAHMIGNLKTKRCRYVRALCKDVQKILPLTGTALTNRPWELFPIVNLLWPEEFDSPFSFGTEFCNGSKEFGQWRFSGAKNLIPLHKKLKALGMIRRTTAQVLKDLPPKRHIVIPLEIDNRAEYERAEKDLVAWLAETDLVAARNAALDVRTRFTHLKKLAGKLKLRYVKEWLDNFLAETDGKILVGVIHLAITAQLQEAYKDQCVVINGTKTMHQRQEAEDTFRKDSKCRIMFGQVKAAGVGLNLPEASTVAMAEFPWTPGACQQFIHRVYRMTSKEPVTAYFLPAYGTIDEFMCEIIERKNKVMDQVLDGVKTQEGSLTIWQELQQRMEEKNK